MRRFTLYRRDIEPGTERFPAQAYNDPATAQVEGVVFSDGRVACRWLTAFRSTVAWDSFADFEAIHGHPEYGTEIVWQDEEGA
jgi:hypothetical protein